MRAIERIEKFAGASVFLVAIAYLLFLLFVVPLREAKTASVIGWILIFGIIFYVFPAFCVAASAYVHVEEHSNLAFCLVLFFGILSFLVFGYFGLFSLYGASHLSRTMAIALMSIALLPSLLCFVTVASAVLTALGRERNRRR